MSDEEIRKISPGLELLLNQTFDMLLQLSSHPETCLLVRFCYLLTGLCNNLPPVKGGTELVQIMNIIANDFI